ncbi:MAG: hypothetical protein AB7I19_07800 [Planctomycetota bacterium]
MAMPPNTRRRLTAGSAPWAGRIGVLVVTLLLSACSHLPSAGWPARSLGEIEVVYELNRGGARRLRIPQSNEELSLLELSADCDGIMEEFVDGQRFWLVPEDADRLHVRCRYRLFLDANDPTDRPALDPALSFPGAQVLMHTARVAAGDDS